jgi:hypothetical protein
MEKEVFFEGSLEGTPSALDPSAPSSREPASCSPAPGFFCNALQELSAKEQGFLPALSL